MAAGDPVRPRVVIGLDVGTTAAKAVAFGIGTGWRHVAVREYPLLEPEPGWQVQQPDAVRAAVVDALAECAARVTGADVAAVSLSAAAHGLVGLDRDLRPLTPLITWADSRAVPDLARVRADGLAADLHQRTGTPVHPMSPLLKLAWFAREQPDVASGVRWWLGLKDLVVLLLTGTLATEASSASCTGLADRWTGGWDPAALAVASVDVDRLPPIRPVDTVVPLAAGIAAAVGLPAGTPVVLGAADGPLANVGCEATEPGVAGLSLGTSAAVRVVVRSQPDRLDPALFCYRLDEGSWVLGGALSTGALVVRWLASVLVPESEPGGAADEAVLALARLAPPGCDGLVMLPHLLAERAPAWDPTLPGAYLGLRRGHGPEHLARAGIEGVALQLAVVVERLGQVVPLTAVRATGGALRAPLWGEVLAAALGRDVEVVGATEGSARGAAALGLRALGLAPDLASAVRLLPDADPDADPDGPGPRRVVPAPADVAALARTRRSVAALAAQVTTSAALLGPAPPTGR